MEAGPLFEFATTVLVVLNQALVEELHLRPLSPARVIRYGSKAVVSHLKGVGLTFKVGSSHV
jgi:hypothetical protein